MTGASPSPRVGECDDGDPSRLEMTAGISRSTEGGGAAAAFPVIQGARAKRCHTMEEGPPLCAACCAWSSPKSCTPMTTQRCPRPPWVWACPACIFLFRSSSSLRAASSLQASAPRPRLAPLRPLGPPARCGPQVLSYLEHAVFLLLYDAEGRCFPAL